MKRVVVCLLMLSILCTSFAFANETDVSLFVNIYNNFTKEYIMNNTKLTVNNTTTYISLLDNLVEDEFIESYEVTQDNVVKNIIIDTQQNITTTEESKIFFRVNGYVLKDSKVDTVINSNDIIEIIFANIEFDIGLDIENVAVNLPIYFSWNQEHSDIINESLYWLKDNYKNDSEYFVAMGVSGRSVDSKLVIEKIKEINNGGDYSTATDIAKDILTLSYCGYDLTNIKTVNLIGVMTSLLSNNELYLYDNTFSLVALDCNGYSLPLNSQVTKSDLIYNMLVLQNDDGGFSYNGQESNLLVTTNVLIALSSYRRTEAINESINRAIQYLINNKDLFYSNSVHIDMVSNLIVALISNGVDIANLSFLNGDETLLDQLLKFKNDDGGFSYYINSLSDENATTDAIIALNAVKYGKNPYIISGQIVTTSQEILSTDNIEFISNKINFWTIAGFSIVVCSIILFILATIYNKRIDFMNKI